MSDTTIILGGALLAVFIAQLAGPSGVPAGTEASPTPQDSSVVVGGDTFAPGPTLPPIATLGPVVNPSAGLDASPTPIPIITLGPPTPRPSATPTGGPGPTPTHKATPKPTPTPPPKPNAAFTCVASGLLLDCTQTSGSFTTSWDWDWGDLAHSTGSLPGSNLQSASHTYAQDNCYLVTLTATGPGGTTIASLSYAVGPTGTCGP